MTSPLLCVGLDAADVHWDLGLARRALNAICVLGGTAVRVDLRWSDLEPAQGQWDRGRAAWYRAFLNEAAHSYGLTPLPVLAGAPTWATRLSHRDRKAFEVYWQVYVARVGRVMPEYTALVEIDLPKGLNLNTLIGLAAATLHDELGPVDVALNVAASSPDWEAQVTALVAAIPRAVDVVGITYAPGAWRLGRAADWSPLARLLHRVNDPDDLWYGLDAAVLGCGFATCLRWWRNEAQQDRWIDLALPAIHRLHQASQARGGAGLRVAAWRRLFDTPTSRCGIFRALAPDGRLVPKLGYEALHYQFICLGEKSTVVEEPDNYAFTSAHTQGVTWPAPQAFAYPSGSRVARTESNIPS